MGGQLLDPAYYNKAIDVATRGVVQVEPYGPALRAQLARALYATGRVEPAIAHLKFALRLDPRFTDGVTLPSELYNSEGRTSEAISMLRDIEARAPGQQGVADELARLEASATTTP
jgi:tetratricopeptide (TPR) repeat protein